MRGHRDAEEIEHGRADVHDAHGLGPEPPAAEELRILREELDPSGTYLKTGG